MRGRGHLGAVRRGAQAVKRLYLIGGTMGVGKTTVCRLLKERLDASVFLDADNLWDMHPFVVNAETKAVVMDNIHFVLNRFLDCSLYQNLIFCWVMHEPSILNAVVQGLDLNDCTLIPVFLVCTPQALAERLQGDIEAGIRQPDVLPRSLERLALYNALPGWRLDVSCKTPEEVCAEIICLGRETLEK